MRKILFMGVLLALSLGHTSLLWAQAASDQPLQEVFQTELVYPQEKGAFQLTSSFTLNPASRELSNDLTIEYGLTRSWQVDLQWQSFARRKTDDGLISRGSGDLRLGAKYSFMRMHGSNFHSAIGFELGLPAAGASKGISESKIEYEPYVVVARDFPGWSRLQLFSQLGLTFSHSVVRSTDDQNNPNKKTIEWNGGMFVPYHRARFTSEISWSKDPTESTLYLTPGLVWKLPHEVEVGVGTPVGISRGAERFKLMVHLVYEFGGDREERN
jgi:hypothetical protein